MKKWAYLAIFSALAIAGCGGSGGDGGGVVPPPSDNFAVNTALLGGNTANPTGSLEVTYNTGQGRGPGAITAVLKKYELTDFLGAINPPIPPELFLQLDGYTSQNVGFNAPMGGFTTNLNGRTFTSIDLTVHRVIVDGSAINGPGGQPLINVPFPIGARVLPGRISSVSIFLNDAMIFPDGGGGITFDQNEFETVNFDPDLQQIVGHISDYIAFDISNVANKPQMLDSSDAEWVAFSGDAIALAKAPVSGASMPFEVLVPLAPEPGAIEGLWDNPSVLPGGTTAGTYSLKQADPRENPGIAFITALQGIWRPWVNNDNPSQSPFLNPNPFVFILFPQSDEAGKYDIICFTHTDGMADEMYFGEANFNSNTFAVWPIDQVDDGDAANEVNGTLSGLVYRPNIGAATPADVRSGTFTFTSGDWPVAFPTTGRFIVYRL